MTSGKRPARKALAKKAGAVVGKSFTAETDLLVVGESKTWAAGDAGGKKLLAALSKGGERKVDLIDEACFLELAKKK